MELHITRLEGNNKQTIGAIQIVEDNKILFSGWTLELPDLENQRRISCIPKGEYFGTKRISRHLKTHIHILNVPNRDLILIHSGNFHFDILGCILVGSEFSDINKDGYADVIHSRATLNKLLGILPNEFKIIIR